MESEKVNTPFMIAIFLTTTVANFASGFALAGYNISAKVIQKQNKWETSTTTLITSAGILGMMLGSLLADKIIPFGRLKAAILANLLVAISVIPMMWFHFFTLIIGRLLLGFGSGLFIVIGSVYMAETIPAQ